ncbi:hypothetical protein JKF63_07887 [Porcisia hertigi]|uniref:J domain-containing protein n=1 Tax=Porcisia hertigi TaxID=2761500 RepID=A0A836LJQ5_9TRYP|nr:hypothetical protein JKF63_07887 [Porcisia hertigi]
MQTLYDVLGIPMSASQDEVRHAYRRLLTRVHPDRCYHDNDSVAYNTTRQLDQGQLHLLQQAYKVLANPLERRKYDTYLAPQWGNRPAAYQQTFQLAHPLNNTGQRQALAIGSGADGGAGVVKVVMDVAAVNSNRAPSTAGPISAYQQPSLSRGVCGDAGDPSSTNPMTRVLNTQVGVAGTAAATGVDSTEDLDKLTTSNTPPTAPVVYTASVSMQRLPDGTLSVRTIKTSPRAANIVVTTDGGIAPGAALSTETPEVHPQQQQQQKPSAAATPSEDSDVHMPHRICVVREHLVMRL